MGHLWTAAEQSLRETQAAHRGKQGMLVHRETGQIPRRFRIGAPCLLALE